MKILKAATAAVTGLAMLFGAAAPAMAADPSQVVRPAGLAADDITDVEIRGFIERYNDIRAEHGLQPLAVDRFLIGQFEWSDLSQEHIDAGQAGTPLSPHAGFIGPNEVVIGNGAFNPHYWAIDSTLAATSWWDSEIHREILFVPEDSNFFEEAAQCIVFNMTYSSYGEGGWDGNWDARASRVNCDGTMLGKDLPAMIKAIEVDASLADYVTPTVKDVAYDADTAATYGNSFGWDPEKRAAFNRGESFVQPRGVTETEAPEPTEIESPEPTEPDQPDPTEPVQPGPTESESPEPTESEQPEPAEPEAPAPTETESPEPTETIQPAPTDPAQPQPEPADPVQPEPTESTAPVPPATVAPEPVEPSSPAEPELTESAPSEPTTPKTDSDGHLAQTGADGTLIASAVAALAALVLGGALVVRRKTG